MPSPTPSASPTPARPVARRILGVDPGSRITGWGVVDVRGNTVRMVAGGAIRTKSKDMGGRLLEIRNGIAAAIREQKPGEVAVETPFFGKNASSALVVGMARGAAMLAAAEAGLALHEYPPAAVKKAVVGRGAASKEQVAAMVRVILGAREIPGPADVSDALAVAVTHAHRSSGPLGSRRT